MICRSTSLLINYSPPELEDSLAKRVSKEIVSKDNVTSSLGPVAFGNLGQNLCSVMSNVKDSVHSGSLLILAGFFFLTPDPSVASCSG